MTYRTATLSLAFLFALAGCVSTPPAKEYRDAHGALWQCPASTPGDCVLSEPPPAEVDLRGLDEGALSA